MYSLVSSPDTVRLEKLEGRLQAAAGFAVRFSEIPDNLKRKESLILDLNVVDP